MSRDSEYSGVAALLRYNLLREAFLAKNKWDSVGKDLPTAIQIEDLSLPRKHEETHISTYFWRWLIGQYQTMLGRSDEIKDASHWDIGLKSAPLPLGYP
jgi:hypothetical protein